VTVILGAPVETKQVLSRVNLLPQAMELSQQQRFGKLWGARPPTDEWLV